MDFDAAFTALIGNEGGYSNDPDDPGGETMWGITLRVARANGYTGDMRNLPQAEAKRIARDVYWSMAHCDELPDGIRFDVFDTSYNSGVSEAIILLQRAMGITADGHFGPETKAKVQTWDDNPYWLRCSFNASRLEFMTGLRNWPNDGKGWARRIAANLRRA